MAKDAKSNKDVKTKKHFFKDFKGELKKVVWPTPKQLFNKTVAVIVIVLITAAIVFVLDLLFKFLNEEGINRLKSKIKSEVVVENTVNNDIEAENTVNNETILETENVVNGNSVENESSVENAQE